MRTSGISDCMGPLILTLTIRPGEYLQVGTDSNVDSSCSLANRCVVLSVLCFGGWPDGGTGLGLFLYTLAI